MHTYMIKIVFNKNICAIFTLSIFLSIASFYFLASSETKTRKIYRNEKHTAQIRRSVDWFGASIKLQATAPSIGDVQNRKQTALVRRESVFALYTHAQFALSRLGRGEREIVIMPGVLLGDVFPNFEADTTIGKIKFHDFLGDSWGILFSHPRDFTPVCTTELACAARLSDEFKKRGVKMIALSIDSVADHCAWSKDVVALHPETAASPLPFPIIADDKRELAVLLGMLDPDERDKDGMPLTARCVFVLGPDKRLKLSILYPATTGRNFTEILRVIDSLQLTANKKVATPVDWKPGNEVMVIPSLSDEEAKKLFPAGFTTKELPSGKKYLRYTPQP